MKAEEEDIITERELKQGIQAKKNAYKKFADYMVRNEKLEDYFLQIDQDKALLVNIYFLNLKSLNFVIE
jgi:DNA invertase Pin-like site-specific DNA recombinase